MHTDIRVVLLNVIVVGMHADLMMGGGLSLQIFVSVRNVIIK